MGKEFVKHYFLDEVDRSINYFYTVKNMLLVVKGLAHRAGGDGTIVEVGWDECEYYRSMHQIIEPTLHQFVAEDSDCTDEFKELVALLDTMSQQFGGKLLKQADEQRIKRIEGKTQNLCMDFMKEHITIYFDILNNDDFSKKTLSKHDIAIDVELHNTTFLQALSPMVKNLIIDLIGRESSQYPIKKHDNQDDASLKKPSCKI